MCQGIAAAFSRRIQLRFGDRPQSEQEWQLGSDVAHFYQADDPDVEGALAADYGRKLGSKALSQRQQWLQEAKERER